MSPLHSIHPTNSLTVLSHKFSLESFQRQNLRISSVHDHFGDDESTKDYNYYSSSNLEDDEGEGTTPPKPANDVSRIDPSDPPHLPGGRSRHESHTEVVGKGEIARIPNIASAT